MDVRTHKQQILTRFSRYGCFLLVTLALLLNGCASMYFRKAGEPPSPPPQYNLAEWPYDEYWTGIVFNGAKIGFTHVSVSPVAHEVDSYDVRSEAVLHFRFLMFDKKVNLRSHDQVAADLTLQRFDYDYDLDGNRLKLSGRLVDGRLEMKIISRDHTDRQTIPVEGKLYPASIIAMYPVLHGLEIGRQYNYQVFDGETQSIGEVTQDILAYEESDLYTGNAFKVKTRLHGQKVTTWIDLRGRPALEIGQGGVIISGLESEIMAKKYLAQASINKEEILLDFSLIRTNVLILEPELVTSMKVHLDGIDQQFNVPNDGHQQCERQRDKLFCQINSTKPIENDGGFAMDDHLAMPYLLSTMTVPSQHELIINKANEIAGEEETNLGRVRLLVQWMQNNIEKEPVDVFTALDVLSTRKAECQGHTYLYSALARSLNIPTRVVNGIVYSEHYQGFLYHTWAESLVNGSWIAVDPTLNQLPADATHIKFVEGENFVDLMPLVDLIGKLQVQIVSIQQHHGPNR
jgi:hypothetical protein